MTNYLLGRDVTGAVPPITAPWPVKDIVYVSIVGGIMLMAFLEWFLWLAAFLYCLWKVYQKAERWSIRLLAVLNAVFFIAMRFIFLPIMIVTLPLPPQVVQYFPNNVVSFLQWFAFWSFAGLLTVPWLFCVYQLVTHNIGRQKRVRHVLDEASAPKVVIVMPCYKEIPEILLRTVDSIVDCDYPPSCLHVFLSFDGDQEDELYLNTIEKLGVPLTLESYPKSIDVVYRSTRITVSRFPHGGKRSCQKKTFKLIDRVYTEYLKRNDNLFILFIDSDCILDRYCIQNFVYEMELKPGSKHNMLAMTGVITSTTEKNSLITILQDMEYIHGQLFERTVESGCGAVTCLPGALTILRFSAFRKMSKYYFADKAEQCEDLFDYGKCHLGEDRWLTHLFMIGAKQRYQIQMNTGAFCKTEAVQDFKTLLKQRRRWFLGFITNEVCMLTDARLWKRYPILLILRLAQNTIRTTALLFFIMVISLMTTSQRIQQLPVGFIGVSLGLNWALMLYFGAKLGRYKIMLYPLMFVVNPFFNWMYMIYGIFTAGQRTWGGPRADAGKADEKTTAQEAIAMAEEEGDDLNVVPESFKPAADIRRRKSGKQTRVPAPIPILPSENLEGRFAPAERTASGWYQQLNESGVTISGSRPYRYHNSDGATYERSSIDSFATLGSNQSIYLPRRVESFLPSEDAAAYHVNQRGQRPAGGQHFEQVYRPRSHSLGSQPDEKQAFRKHGYGDLESQLRFPNGRGDHEPKFRSNSRDSIESLDLHPGARGREATRRGSYSGLDTNPIPARGFANQASPGPPPPALRVSPSSPDLNAAAPKMPQDFFRRHGDRTSTSANRQGPSPLSRRSFVRTIENLPDPDPQDQRFRPTATVRHSSANAVDRIPSHQRGQSPPAALLFSQPNLPNPPGRARSASASGSGRTQEQSAEETQAERQAEAEKKRKRLTKDKWRK